jgi:hypothetical protein
VHAAATERGTEPLAAGCMVVVVVDSIARDGRQANKAVLTLTN